MHACGGDLTALAKCINEYVKSLTNLLMERELIVSQEKSTVTLFTPDSGEAQVHPVIYVQEQRVKLDKTPKLLGVTFDTMFCFGPHIQNTINKAEKKLNILKALAGQHGSARKKPSLSPSSPSSEPSSNLQISFGPPS